MLQWYIRALADLSINVKTYQHGISGAVARDTPVSSDCAKKCKQHTRFQLGDAAQTRLEVCVGPKLIVFPNFGSQIFPEW